MSDQTEFKASLIKPMFAFIALLVLNAAAAIAIAIDHFTHVQPYWRSSIYRSTFIWNTFINIALIGGWFFYLQIRKSKASRKQ